MIKGESHIKMPVETLNTYKHGTVNKETGLMKSYSKMLLWKRFLGAPRDPAEAYLGKFSRTDIVLRTVWSHSCLITLWT